jgi:hypothetical protein
MPPRLPQLFLSAVSPLEGCCEFPANASYSCSLFSCARCDARAGADGHLRHGRPVICGTEHAFTAWNAPVPQAHPTVDSSLLPVLQGCNLWSRRDPLNTSLACHLLPIDTLRMGFCTGSAALCSSR